MKEYLKQEEKLKEKCENIKKQIRIMNDTYESQLKTIEDNYQQFKNVYVYVRDDLLDKTWWSSSGVVVKTAIMSYRRGEGRAKISFEPYSKHKSL